jgi:abortive infection bacteriophage resistance protein
MGMPIDRAHLARVHQFDTEFRRCIGAMLESVELALRGRVDRVGLDLLGQGWHLRADSFRRGAELAMLHERMESELRRSFALDLRPIPLDERLHRLPFGRLAEELSLGTMSRICGALVPSMQHPIAESFDVPRSTLRGTLQYAMHVRNLCAHHVRLTGRTVELPPPSYRSPARLASALDDAAPRSPFRAYLIVRHLAESVPGTSAVLERVNAVIRHDPGMLAAVGCNQPSEDGIR